VDESALALHRAASAKQGYASELSGSGLVISPPYSGSEMPRATVRLRLLETASGTQAIVESVRLSRAAASAFLAFSAVAVLLASVFGRQALVRERYAEVFIAAAFAGFFVLVLVLVRSAATSSARDDVAALVREVAENTRSAV
jgi:hypothetical protein